MLVRVPRAEVTLGMFIHAMEGSWLDHPFWRRKFLLTDPADLARLHASVIPAVMVDATKGLAPGMTAATAPAARATPPRPPLPRLRPEPIASRIAADTACSAREELARASKIVRKSKLAVMRMFGEARLGKAIRTSDVAPLVEEIAASVARNRTALIGVARLKDKDEYTYMHSVAVCALMINFARTLELEEETVRQAGLAGLLHDIGKTAVPDAVLNKPGKLDDAEVALVRDHPRRGHELLLLTEDMPHAALDVCLHHHERIDGGGYPDGLTGDRLSLLVRMSAICDVYDAITSERAYKEAWSPADSIARMLEWEGHFDPVLLAAFIRSIGIYPLGTLVRLRSNRLGIVTAENRREPTLPRVRAFYSIMDRAIVAYEDVDTTATLKGDQIICREDPDRWRLPDWTALAARIVAAP